MLITEYWILSYNVILVLLYTRYINMINYFYLWSSLINADGTADYKILTICMYMHSPHLCHTHVDWSYHAVFYVEYFHWWGEMMNIHIA